MFLTSYFYRPPAFWAAPGGVSLGHYCNSYYADPMEMEKQKQIKASAKLTTRTQLTGSFLELGA